MKLIADGLTDVGMVRNNNEDNFCVDAEAGFFAVADGVGGASAGEVASKSAVEVMRDYIRKTASGGYLMSGHTEGSLALKRITSGISLANQVVYDASRSNPSLKDMGTTVAAVLLQGNRLSVANVGDSRVYLIRAGTIIQLSEDHSLVAEQVRAGLLTKEQAEMSGMKNIITRALGQAGDVEPYKDETTVMDRDVVLLCSDGLTNMVDEADIVSTVNAFDGPSGACRALVDMANENGGKDNVTVVLVYISKEGFTSIINKLFRSGRR